MANRQWPEEAKRQVLAEIDAIKAKGSSISEYLGKQGLFSSTVSVWRKNLGWKSNGKAASSRPKQQTLSSNRPRTAVSSDSGDLAASLVAMLVENDQLKEQLQEMEQLREENAKLKTALEELKEAL